jgi:hypothetical protein
MQFQNIGLDFATFAVLLALICGFAIMLRRRRKRPELMERPQRDIAYEWLAEPLKKASADLRSKFSDLDELSSIDGIQLIRLGIFNLGTAAVEPVDFESPITVEFEDQVELLGATTGEAHRTAVISPDSATIDNGTVRISPLNIAGGGTVIFNIVARNGIPHQINGSIAGFGPIRRLN